MESINEISESVRDEGVIEQEVTEFVGVINQQTTEADQEFKEQLALHCRPHYLLLLSWKILLENKLHRQWRAQNIMQILLNKQAFNIYHVWYSLKN